jgi:hypothetical protein
MSTKTLIGWCFVGGCLFVVGGAGCGRNRTEDPRRDLKSAPVEVSKTAGGKIMKIERTTIPKLP